jgi:hypothetical protein
VLDTLVLAAAGLLALLVSPPVSPAVHGRAALRAQVLLGEIVRQLLQDSLHIEIRILRRRSIAVAVNARALLREARQAETISTSGATDARVHAREIIDNALEMRARIPFDGARTTSVGDPSALLLDGAHVLGLAFPTKLRFSGHVHALIARAHALLDRARAPVALVRVRVLVVRVLVLVARAGVPGHEALARPGRHQAIGDRRHPQ